jgi:adenine deaminase
MAGDVEKFSGQITDVVAGRIFPGEIHVKDGRIADIIETPKAERQYIVPGLVDAHVHIESSMLVPSEFARLAVVHGTVATVSDPHEIANVVGVRGVEYMIENAAKVPFYFNFGAPSCVPATVFETAGAEIGPSEIETLLQRPDIKYLSEMMNYPGVINRDPVVMEKIKIAQKYKKPVDGHAPGLTGEDLKKYIAAGISTDHECYTYEEALEKLKLGMKILIREGSAAKNFNTLIELIRTYPEMIMFCSDDKHPDALVKGHINELVRRALEYDFNPIDVLRAATLNPVRHYKLENGLLQKGDFADFIIVDDLSDFEVKQTYIKGQKVAENGTTLIPSSSSNIINHFDCNYINPEDLVVPANGKSIRIIEINDGQLITGEGITEPCVENNVVLPDLERDILKLVVVNRYKNAAPAVGFVTGFELKQGAIASTVAHDSHNIIAVGVDDTAIKRAINLLIQNKGGISIVMDNEGENANMVLPLPIGGLMSGMDGYSVAEQYERIDEAAKANGSSLTAPFMTLSFLALLVIPKLKLSDKGLFDGSAFKFVDLYAEK